MPFASRVNRTTNTGALEASKVLSAVPCVLQEISATNTSGSTLYFLVFNSATVPADSAVPYLPPIAVPATGTSVYDLQHGESFSAGCSVCLSTTAHVKTIAGAVAVFGAVLEG